MKSGILDKNEKEIEVGQRLRWKHFDGSCKGNVDFPSEEEFEILESDVVYKDAAIGIFIKEKFTPLANLLEDGQLFNHSYFGSYGEFMHVIVDCDFEIIN